MGTRTAGSAGCSERCGTGNKTGGPASAGPPVRRSHHKGNLWDKAAALPGGRFVCFEEGENHSPWAILAVEIFLKAAMSLPAIRSYPRPYSSAAAAEAS